MILVTVGTLEYPFPRLLQACRGLEELEDDVVVQCGTCADRPFRAIYVDYLPPEVLSSLMGEGRAVLTHAGIGSVATALRQGIRPIVMPRRKRLHESVDDHQVKFAARIEQMGYAVQLEHLSVGLGRYIRTASFRPTQVTPTGDVIGAVRTAIRRHAGPPSLRAPSGDRAGGSGGAGDPAPDRHLDPGRIPL